MATRRGPTPDERIRQFQTQHVNHLGHPLDADGVLGPETLWVLQLQTVHPDRRAICARAVAKLGTVEVPRGSNRSPQIDAWLSACQVDLGQAWCAASASDSIGRVAIAGALRLLARYPETQTPMPGDVYGYPTDDRGHGHVGVLAGASATEVFGWEGNVDSEQRCVRRARAGLTFGRTIADVSGTCPHVIQSVALRSNGLAGTR